MDISSFTKFTQSAHFSPLPDDVGMVESGDMRWNRKEKPDKSYDINMVYPGHGKPFTMSAFWAMYKP